MIVSFNIEYRTNWGEDVRVLGSTTELGNNDHKQAIPLRTTDGTHWGAEVELSYPEAGIANYIYVIYKENQVVREEWHGIQRCLLLPQTTDAAKKITVHDSWKNLPEEQYFYSSAFTESLLAHRKRGALPKSHKKGLMIKAYAPRISEDYCLAISGNQTILGNWEADKALPMSDACFPEWVTEVDASNIPTGI